MMKNVELTGNLLDYKITDLIIQLRGIKQAHNTGSAHIDVNDVAYDARLIYKALEVLEEAAKTSNLNVKPITVDNNLDELLGNTKSQKIEVITSLDIWELLQLLDKTND